MMKEMLNYFKNVQMKTNTIIHGDSIEMLKTLPEKSINMCMTSPPYWALRDYGDGNSQVLGGRKDCEHDFRIIENKNPNDRGGNSQFDDKGIGAFMGEEVTTKPNLSGFCNKCNAWKGQLGLEPTFDLYIKHLCDIFDEVKKVLRDNGTCWVNLGDNYIGGGGGNYGSGISSKQGDSHETNMKNRPEFIKANKIQSKSLTMIPFRFAIEMVNRGWILRNTIIWHKPSCMPSSVKDRFTVDFEYLFFFSKKKKYYFEQQLDKTITKDNTIRDRDTTKLNNTPGRTRMGGLNINDYDLKNKRTVWTINPKPFKEAHFAVYPEELCETPVKAGCPEGGIVLDPFFGSGTTGLVALKQNKKFIGIELNKKYIEIANKRLLPHLEQTKLTKNV
ncbi:hypothetical protein LCGC14_0476350 [marine sediment metagenome]|uniref:site-specific DNA-methyltransferase (cytosine-N(4)-specific) n=1 Tax=marine sediment metagenome TaxID=412755 RepID=A0A0F9STH6_9ZZZZ